LARRIAQAAGLEVWGTLKLPLEAKAKGLIREVNVYLDRLEDAGLWVLSNVRRRILTLAGED
jgi:predicted nucleic acid-binding protein